MPAEIPILLIVFNRPDKTSQVLSALRNFKPQHLFVAADGPRPGVADDAERCATTRRLLDEIDWNCEVRTLFHDSNLGCKRGPEHAISWFFSQVRSGIILEDDCVPTADFFPFCAELLERFEDCEKIMMIGGHNLLGSWPHAATSYLFSRTAPTWGWATWRRAWERYDPAMTAWSSADVQRRLRSRMPAAEFRVIRRIYDRVRTGSLDAWDYAWSFAMLQADGLSVVPTRNLITNIGFGEDATHTKNALSADARVATAELTFPLRHPTTIELSDAFESAFNIRRFPIRRQILALLPKKPGDHVRAIFHSLLARIGRP
jgi:hypothetical protein